MKKLFQRAIAWLRSRVTVVNTQSVYDNVNVNEHLHGINSRLMECVSAYRFGSILLTLGVTRHQHHDRRVYAVIPINR